MNFSMYFHQNKRIRFRNCKNINTLSETSNPRTKL
ncbi:hypothetical protein Pint_06497 [Pistacia integerrima]|uniref:Uncharacterized protein n=1 Tax=Pistacia integerrima TaxID=434235 RepID=A0ACC0Z9T1_9ROSI|nr:hypothetical protein Pint_06497 [Pistacia integerrima]